MNNTKNKELLKIAVIYGGKEEYGVSKITGGKVHAALLFSGYKSAYLLEFANNIIDELQKNKPDVVFNAMHGFFGEDGRLPALLDLMQIPYTHSGYYASFIGMQKDIVKDIAKHHSIDVAKDVTFYKKNFDGNFDKFYDIIGSNKLVLKPNNSGSSVSVFILEKNKTQFEMSMLDNFDHFIVEEYIDGLEISIPVVENKAQGILALIPKNGFYDYKNKYTDNMTIHQYPADMPQDKYNQAMLYAEEIHNALGCKYTSRSDMRYDPETGRVVFLEINTHPGMTDLSITPDVMKHKGIEYHQLIEMIMLNASYDKF